MFVQVIEGRAKDAEALRARFDSWEKELRPGAAGFLGSTGGVAADGTFIVVARFEDEAAARRNSDRPEQGEWWKATEQLIDGATFTDSSEVDLYLGGGSDEAGFVQVMRGAATDKAKVKSLTPEIEEQLRAQRPDVLGGYTVWSGDSFTEVIYFTSEADARDGEKSMAEPTEVLEQWQAAAGDIRYIDLPSPMIS